MLRLYCKCVWALPLCKQVAITDSKYMYHILLVNRCRYYKFQGEIDAAINWDFYIKKINLWFSNMATIRVWWLSEVQLLTCKMQYTLLLILWLYGGLVAHYLLAIDCRSAAHCFCFTVSLHEITSFSIFMPEDYSIAIAVSTLVVISAWIDGTQTTNFWQCPSSTSY